MDFDWKRKSRLQEQLKFFGAKKTRFISCYAKKPKIKVKLKPNIKIETDLEVQTLSGLANLASQTSALGGAFMCQSGLGVSGPAGSAYLAAQAQAAALGQAQLAAQQQFQGGAFASLIGCAGPRS